MGRPPLWSPTQEDYSRIFREQNPWHQSGSVPEALAPAVERPLAKQLWHRVLREEPSRFQLVLGPRRVGKTTAMYQTVRHLLASGIPPRRLWWLRLDHPLLIPLSLDALVRFVAQTAKATPEEPVFLFLDELAYATDWDLWLKTFYDERRPLRIVATSSSTAALRNRRMESGVGRWEEQYLAPYLLTEFLDLASRPVALGADSDLAGAITNAVSGTTDLSGLAELRTRFLLTGGFPELLIPLTSASPDAAGEELQLLHAQRTLRSDAVERALYKDIPQAFGLDRPMVLERLLYVLAGQITGVLSPNKICESLDGLSQPTFDRYLSYLERAFLVFTLPNFSPTEKGVQKRGRKLYFVDGAVRNAALQRGSAPKQDSVEMGHLLENAAASHLHALSQQAQVRLFHWRHGGDEVDLVYNHPESPLAFEISLSPNHSRAGLRAFVSRFPRFKGRCYMVSEVDHAIPPEADRDSIGTLPLDMFLVVVGKQAESQLLRRLL